MFIKQFISTFKKVRLENKIYLQQQREKKALLSAKSDFSLLEKLIRHFNFTKLSKGKTNGRISRNQSND